MEKFGASQTAKRSEDLRLLTGNGQYIDDIAPEGALFGYAVRSSVAHGTITELDVSDARNAPGVHAVITAADLA
ncbi:MAG: hypothetical protein VYA97_03000, partial [Pseudomonadota bacterium]|nr:hypothetical protein [Pseudomonadota bacterium]